MPDIFGVDTGEFLGGNSENPLIAGFNNAMDVLNVGGYAAAGATEAMLSGANPFEGAMYGVQNRMSFIDTFKSKDVPFATLLGVGADLLVPTVPVFHLASLLKTKQVSEIYKATKELHAGKSLLESHKIARQIFAPEIMAKTGFEAKQAAQATEEFGPRIAELIGGMKDREAILNSRSPELVKGETWVGQSVFGKRGWQELKSELFAPANHTLRTGQIFSGVGEHMADALDVSQRVTTHMRAVYAQRADEIIKKLGRNSKDHRLWYMGSQGVLPKFQLPKHVEEAIEMTKKLMKEDFELKKSLGARELLSVETALFKRMSMQDRSFVAELVNNQGKLNQILDAGERATPKQEYLARFAFNIVGSGGELDFASGHVTAPLREVTGGYLPRVAAPKKANIGKAILRSDTAQRLFELENLNPKELQRLMELGDPVATKKYEAIQQFAEQISRDMMDDPTEIIGGFQHQRGAHMRTPKWDDLDSLIHNPTELLYRWAGDSGLVVGSIEGFGAKHEIFSKIRSTYLKNHGIIDELRPDMIPADTRYGLDFLDTAFRVATGTNKSGLDKAVGFGSRLADAMFLGPRTVAVQLMNLSNSAAHTGVLNSFAGMGEAMRNPEFRKIGEHIAGILPNLADTSQSASTMQKWLDKISFVYGGIKHSDSLMRSQSAMAGMLTAMEHAKDIQAAARAGNLNRANELLNSIKSNFKTDLSYLLEEGTKIKSHDLWRIGNMASTKANFSNAVLESPMLFNRPAGKFFLKFKQFAYHQTRFIWDATEKFVKAKPFSREQREAGAALLRYGAMFGWVNSHLEPVLDLFKNKKMKKGEKDKAAERIRRIALLGAFGYMGEAAVGLGSDSEALGLGMVAGPVWTAGLKAKKTFSALAVDPLVGKFDPDKVISSGPALIRQGKYLWENSTQ